MRLNIQGIPDPFKKEQPEALDHTLSESFKIGSIECALPVSESAVEWAQARFLADTKAYIGLNPPQMFPNRNNGLYLYKGDVLFETVHKKYVVVTAECEVSSGTLNSVYEGTHVAIEGASLKCSTLYRLKDRSKME